MLVKGRSGVFRVAVSSERGTFHQVSAKKRWHTSIIIIRSVCWMYVCMYIF